ncbi:MAG: helix-turn-helix transcriptional regulator [Lachnospiraceae bacterium]|nr:helix-turn-helix transcriptional regulator [Lachnospiraceae bacterium]
MDYFFKTEELEEIIEINQNKAKNVLAQMYTECRKSKRITQEELAKRAGISRTNITRFEGGDYNPSVEMLVKIANAMDMNVNIQLEEIADGE